MKIIINIVHLIRTGLVLIRSNALLTQGQVTKMPIILQYLIFIMRFDKILLGRNGSGKRKERLSKALRKLGPSHVKLGQFLATRPDIIGNDLSDDLSSLQDKLPPFPHEKAIAEIENGLGSKVDELFIDVSEPISAASIAQVHKGKVEKSSGSIDDVAIKILRPKVEKRFNRDLESFFFAARTVEYFSKKSRRLRLIDTVQTMADSVHIEMDLRMEAAAISEMAQNCHNDCNFRVPKVDWQRTSKRVLTLEWIDGTPLNDIDALKARNCDLVTLSENVIQTFLKHAIRDGFFHADMHQGNLFIDGLGKLVAVDFGIMGRLSIADRRFLAGTLYGFINRDYAKVAQMHFDIGYIPIDQSPEIFSQALRSIGEPILGLDVEDISMAKLLGQLFHVTERFNMVTQPQLILLQKTMVMVEGVARNLNPKLNMWQVARPVLEAWAKEQVNPVNKLFDLGKSTATMGNFMLKVPDLMQKTGHVIKMLDNMAKNDGFNLTEENINKMTLRQQKSSKVRSYAIWIIAISMLTIAVKLVSL